MMERGCVMRLTEATGRRWNDSPSPFPLPPSPFPPSTPIVPFFEKRRFSACALTGLYINGFQVRSVAQPGSALDWGSRGRGFESRRSDHLFKDLRHPPPSSSLHKKSRFTVAVHQGFFSALGGAHKHQGKTKLCHRRESPCAPEPLGIYTFERIR